MESHHRRHAPAAPPAADEARDALRRATRATDAAIRRGLYPRGVAVLVSLWAGSLAIVVGFASPLLLPLLFGGLAGAAWWRRRRALVIREVTGQRALWFVVPAGLLLGAIFIGGRIAHETLGAAEAPLVAGALVATLLYSIMEFSYRRIWDGPASPHA